MTSDTPTPDTDRQYTETLASASPDTSASQDTSAAGVLARALASRLDKRFVEALALLDKALADQHRVEETTTSALYLPSIRWELVRQARRLLQEP